MDALNSYQDQLKQLLITSTITWGLYKPTSFVRSTDHIAVLLDGKPVYLAGEADCVVSRQQAFKIAMNDMFKIGLSNIGLTGELSYGVVSGASIEWKDSHHAIVKSKQGFLEDGQGVGELIGIDLTDNKSLMVLLCVNDSLAKILDPQCPELDNGRDLAFLAQII